jgi:steroid delta-isomerase-like uncharacterized protein
VHGWEDNERILREFIERVWNRGDLDAAADYLADHYTVHSDPGDPWEGHTLALDAFRFRLGASRAPFPDLTFELDEVVAAGDRVAASWTMRGTHTAAMGDLPPSGRRIEVRGFTVYYFADGRITGHRQVVDRLAVMQQLGLMPPPP